MHLNEFRVNVGKDSTQQLKKNSSSLACLHVLLEAHQLV